MNLSLTPTLEQFIRDQAESGRYNNASEVVRHALRLMQREEEEYQLKMDRLREELAKGEADIAAGRTVTLSSKEERDAFFANL